MNLRYAPSMRNGADQSDRGNAILSTLPLDTGAGGRLQIDRGVVRPVEIVDDDDQLVDLGVPLVCAGGIGDAAGFVAALRPPRGGRRGDRRQVSVDI